MINDTLFMANPINIAGYKFKFTKLSPSLVGFGIKNKDEIVRYSDPEKIVLDISEWAKHGSKEKLMSYAKRYLPPWKRYFLYAIYLS